MDYGGWTIRSTGCSGPAAGVYTPGVGWQTQVSASGGSCADNDLLYQQFVFGISTTLLYIELNFNSPLVSAPGAWQLAIFLNRLTLYLIKIRVTLAGCFCGQVSIRLLV